MLLLLILSIYFSPSLKAQSEFQIKNRIQIGGEYDSNIYESQKSEREEPSTRFLFQSNGDKYLSKSVARYQCSVGYQAYERNANEDKLISEILLNGQHQFTNRITGAVTIWSRTKQFRYTPIDYSLYYVNLYTTIRIWRKFSLILSYKPEKLNYWNDDDFGYQSHEFLFLLNKNISQKCTAGIGLSFNNLYFKNKAYERVPGYEPDQVSDQQHRDEMKKLSLNFKYFGLYIFNFSYYYMVNNSNSYGLSYNNQYIVISFSKKLPHKILLRLYTMLQKKDYFVPDPPPIYKDLDTEREDNNYLTIDFSRTFTHGLLAFFRLGWYYNESPLPEKYFQKQTSTAGFEFRF